MSTPDEHSRADEPSDTSPDGALSRRGHLLHLLGLGSLLVLALVLVWAYTPLQEYATVKAATEGLHGLADSPFGPLYLVLAQALLGLVAFPYTVLATVTGYLYEPPMALLINFVGCAANASLSFYVGRWLGLRTVRQYGGRAIRAINRRLSRRGFLAVVILRNLPIAPFTVINMVCGAAEIRFRDYLLGTQLGMAPGLVALTLFGDQLERALSNPSASTIAWLLGAAALVIAVALGVERWAERRDRQAEKTPQN